MVELFKYIESLYSHIPKEVYIFLFVLLCLSLIFSMVINRHQRKRYILLSLLLEYVCFVFCSTVIFRDYVKIRKFNLIPFWSYAAIIAGQKNLLIENLMNIAVFVPIGFLLGTTNYKKFNWQGVFLMGLALSLVIETMQFLFTRGFAEVDDVMHNTLGCQIGYGVYICLLFIMKRSGKC